VPRDAASVEDVVGGDSGRIRVCSDSARVVEIEVVEVYKRLNRIPIVYVPVDGAASSGNDRPVATTSYVMPGPLIRAELPPTSFAIHACAPTAAPDVHVIRWFTYGVHEETPASVIDASVLEFV
jgi:hypothetical protein